MIRVHVSNSIRVFGLSKAQISAITKPLTLPNPLFHRLLRLGKASPWMSREFKYYHLSNGILEIPRGCRMRLLRFLENSSLEFTVEEDLVHREI